MLRLVGSIISSIPNVLIQEQIYLWCHLNDFGKLDCALLNCQDRCVFLESMKMSPFTVHVGNIDYDFGVWLLFRGVKTDQLCLGRNSIRNHAAVAISKKD